MKRLKGAKAKILVLVLIVAIIFWTPGIGNDWVIRSNAKDYTNGGCVSWVKDRAAQIGITLPSTGLNKYGLYGASAYWDTLSAYPHGSEPAANALAVWEFNSSSDAGYKKYGHVAFVESVNGDNVTVTEGGCKGYSYNGHTGVINRTKSKSQMATLGGCSGFYGYIYLTNNAPTISEEWTASAKDITETNATLSARYTVGSKVQFQYAGCNIFDANGNMIAQAGENTGVNNTYINIWYDINSETHEKLSLQPGTTYKYQFYATYGGVDHFSPMYSFNTSGTATPDISGQTPKVTVSDEGKVSVSFNGVSNVHHYDILLKNTSGTIISYENIGTASSGTIQIGSGCGNYVVCVRAYGSNGTYTNSKNVSIVWTAEYQSLEVKKEKVQYYIGESIGLDDLEVTATYSDGSTKLVDSYTTNISDIDMNYAGKKDLVISYTEGEVTKNSTIRITVLDKTVKPTEESTEKPTEEPTVTPTEEPTVASTEMKPTESTTTEKITTESTTTEVLTTEKITTESTTTEVLTTEKITTESTTTEESTTNNETCKHEFISKIIKEPTCEEDGEKMKLCLKCDKVETEKVVATGHVMDEGIVTKEATSKEQGEKTYTCKNCGATKTETIPMVEEEEKNETCEHEFISKITKEPTCEEDGEKINICMKCKQIKTEKVVATGHVMDEGIVTKEATSKEQGEKTYTCKNCGATKTETIPMVEEEEKNETCEHEFISKITKEPTCEEDGEKVNICMKCKQIETEKVAATGHSYSADWTVDLEATTTAEGSKSHHCAKCDAKTDITPIPMVVTQTPAIQNTSSQTEKVENPTAQTSKTAIQKPSKVIMLGLWKVKKKQMKVSWYNMSSADGYQLVYATDKKFKAGKKTIDISGGSNTSKVLKKLKIGKKYYAKVRAYKIINGQKVYGAWSKKTSKKLIKGISF